MGKPSRGVVIFGCLFIIGGIFGLWGGLVNLRAIQNMPGFLGLIGSITGIICGIMLFQLHKYARIVAIALAIYGILSSIAVVLMPIPEAAVDQFRLKEEQRIRTEVPLGEQQGELERLEKIIKFTHDKKNSITFWLLLPGFIFNIGAIYFFTRKEVKGQFEEREGRI